MFVFFKVVFERVREKPLADYIATIEREGDRHTERERERERETVLDYIVTTAQRAGHNRKTTPHRPSDNPCTGSPSKPYQ